MPSKRKRESLETTLSAIPRSGSADETLALHGDEITASFYEGNETGYMVSEQDGSTFDETSTILDVHIPPTPEKPEIEFPDDADTFDVETIWPLYQVTNLPTAKVQPQNEWGRRLEGYRLKHEEIVDQWRTSLKEQESEVPTEEEIALLELDPDWHEPKMDEKVQPMPYAELIEIAHDLGLSLKLRKTSRGKLGSLKSTGQQATLAQIPIEVGMDIVRYMIHNWQARQTDLYDTLYQIRCTNVLNAAYCTLPDAERRLLPSSDPVTRINSFVTLHCNLTQAQLLGILQRLQLIWPGPGMVRWAGLPQERQTTMQRIITPWFKLALFILENNNIQHMSRLLLRDIRRESGEMWSVELRLPSPPPMLTAAPSIGRCINMGAIDQWLDLFDTNNIQDNRLHRNLRYSLWSLDRDTYSFSPRGTVGNSTTHAFSRGNSITEACLFESYSYHRYPDLDPSVHTDLTVPEAHARIMATGNIIDRQWLNFINNGQ